LTKKNTLLEIVVAACEDRKADNCVALDMQRLTPMTDYYVICNGNNERQVQAIARAVKEAAEANQFEVKRTEGFNQARWILLDLGDVVCHIFHKDERHYYNLERLWGDAEQIHIGDNTQDDL